MTKFKGILPILLAVVLIFVFTACGQSKDSGQINLMTWGGDFIPREIIMNLNPKQALK